MKANNKNKKLKSSTYLLILIVIFSFFQAGVVKAQDVETTGETELNEADWNVASNQDTEQEAELAEQQKLWDEWDAAHPSENPESSVVIYEETEEKKNRVKSPNEVLTETLIGNWEGFYGGSEAYISFKENKTVTINTSIFSNVPSASGKGYVQYYYEIDASKSPYQLIFYNRNREIKGVFRINNENSITICHNFKNDEQPQEIDNKYTIMNLSKVQAEEQTQQHTD